MRKLIAAIVLLALVGCASGPKQATTDPSKTPISVIGLFECGKFDGVLIVTQDGKIHPEPDVTLDQALALSHSVPQGNAGAIHPESCAPTQGT